MKIIVFFLIDFIKCKNAVVGEMKSKINKIRKEKHLIHLKNNSILQNVAQDQVDHMAKIGKLTHASRDLLRVKKRLSMEGLKNVVMTGENIAKSTTLKAYKSIVNLWINSKEHRNILLNDFTDIAVALNQDNKDSSGKKTIYWIALFAKINSNDNDMDDEGYNSEIESENYISSYDESSEMTTGIKKELLSLIRNKITKEIGNSSESSVNQKPVENEESSDLDDNYSSNEDLKNSYQNYKLLQKNKRKKDSKLNHDESKKKSKNIYNKNKPKEEYDGYEKDVNDVEENFDHKNTKNKKLNKSLSKENIPSNKLKETNENPKVNNLDNNEVDKTHHSGRDKKSSEINSDQNNISNQNNISEKKNKNSKNDILNEIKTFIPKTLDGFLSNIKDIINEKQETKKKSNSSQINFNDSKNSDEFSKKDEKKKVDSNNLIEMDNSENELKEIIDKIKNLLNENRTSDKPKTLEESDKNKENEFEKEKDGLIEKELNELDSEKSNDQKNNKNPKDNKPEKEKDGLIKKFLNELNSEKSNDQKNNKNPKDDKPEKEKDGLIKKFLNELNSEKSNDQKNNKNPKDDKPEKEKDGLIEKELNELDSEKSNDQKNNKNPKDNKPEKEKERANDRIRSLVNNALRDIDDLNSDEKTPKDSLNKINHKKYQEDNDKLKKTDWDNKIERSKEKNDLEVVMNDIKSSLSDIKEILDKKIQSNEKVEPTKNIKNTSKKEINKKKIPIFIPKKKNPYKNKDKPKYKKLSKSTYEDLTTKITNKIIDGITKRLNTIEDNPDIDIGNAIS